MKDLGQQIVELSNKYDEPGSMVNEPIKNNKLNPRQYKQMMNYLVRNKNKDSIDERRVPLKKKSDTKVPPKIAKSKEDLEEEFEVIEIPILMKEFEIFKNNNPGKNFEDFLKEQKLIQKQRKKQLDQIMLSSALNKIDDAMGGIMQNLAKGGIIRDPSFTYYDDGGVVKNKPKGPKKLLNISDYFRLGATVAELTPYERELVTELVKKTFSKSSTDN
tara:strand:+ start:518 stop:1168 length:651 start_codon:yes stop_codon:yes gene_type:complete